MELKKVWDSEGQADWSEVKSQIEGTSHVMYAKMKGEEDVSEQIDLSNHWAEFFKKTEWRKKLSKKWQKKNPGWEERWQEPKEWLPGEREWIEWQDSFWEKIRRYRKKKEREQQEAWEKLPEEYRRKSKEF
jgi:hypothetical protein